MNRRIIAWMLASCMAMSMAGPVLAEAAAGTDNNVTADSKEPAESNTDTKETTDKGEAGTTEGEAGKTEGEAGKTEGEAGTTEGEAGKTEGETGKTEGEAGTTEGETGKTEGEAGTTEGEAGKTEGEAADANGTPANNETPQPNNALTTTADETTAPQADKVNIGVIHDGRIQLAALKAAGKTGTSLNISVPDNLLLTAGDLSKITSIDVSGLGNLNDLGGIEVLTSLTNLNASGNAIVALNVVQWDKLQQLKTLDLSGNKVADLSFLNSSNLETLKLNNQKPEAGTLNITDSNLNISTLKTLEASNCNLGSLKVANDLTTLIASGNPGLSGAVSTLPKSLKNSLTKLDLSNCNIQDPSELSGFSALEDLDLSGNATFANTGIVTGLTSLKKLNLSRTGISYLQGITVSSALESLDVSNTKLPNFSTLSASCKTSLKTLNAANITTLKTLSDLTQFTALEELDASGTYITDTQGLSGMTKLLPSKLNLNDTRIPTEGDLTANLPSNFKNDNGYASWLTALKENLKLDSSDKIEEAKKPLQNTIDDANELLKSRQVSTTGSDIPQNQKWVTQADQDEFTNAIAAAQSALNDANATEASLTAARSTLWAAYQKFDQAGKPGTQAVLDLTVLSTPIANARGAMSGIVVASKADEVLEGQKWVTALVKSTFEKAITAAETLYENAQKTPASVTQADLQKAADDLNAAAKAFRDAFEGGTKPQGFKDYLGGLLASERLYVESITPSADGVNVSFSKMWATQENINTFKKAIETAQQVYDNPNATKDQVDNAADALKAARTTFDGQCSNGQQKVEITDAANPTSQLTLTLGETTTINVSDLATDCGAKHGKLTIEKVEPSSGSAVTATPAPDKKSLSIEAKAAGKLTLTITVDCSEISCNASKEYTVECTVNNAITAFEPLEDVDAGAEGALLTGYTTADDAAASLKTKYSTVKIKGTTTTVSVTSWACDTPTAYGKSGTYVFTAKLNDTPPSGYTYGDGVKATVNVIVKPGNNAPTAKAVPTQTVKVGAKATLPVSSLASDVDKDDVLAITKVVQPADGSATVTYTNDTLTITPVKAGSGSTTVTVSDGKNTVDVTVNITVNEAASIPEKTIADRKLAVKSVDEINVSDLAADCTDGHKNLKIVSALSNATGNATVVFDDAKVTVTGVAAGNATITVKVACGGASGTTCAAQREFTVKYTVETEAAEKFTLTQNATKATVKFYSDSSASTEITSAEVNKGSQIWVKVTPDNDHEISSFSVNGVDKKADLNSSNIAGPYIINQNTTVSASAVQIDHTPTVTIKNATGTYKVDPPTTTDNQYTVTVTLKLPTGFKAEKVQYYVDGNPSSAKEITAANGVYSFKADPDKAYIVFVTTAADDSYKKVEINNVSAITTAVVKEDQIPDVPTNIPSAQSVVLTISNPAVPATPNELETAGTTLAAQNSNIQAIDTDKAIQMDISLQVLDASNKKVGDIQPKGSITVLMNVPAAFKGKDFLALHYKDNTSIPAIIYPNILEGGEQFSITTTSLSTFVLAPYTKASRPTPTPSPTPSNNGSGGGSSGGGGGSSSGGRSTGVFDKLTSTINGLLKQALTGMKPGTASGTVSNGTPVTAAAANKAAASAIAKGKGDGSGKADVLFRNASTISPEILSSVASQAQKAGLKAYVTVDSMQKGAVDVRVSVLASAAARLGKAIDLSAKIGNQAIERHFAKYFKNRIAVIDLAQNGPFGTPASVAARVNLGADAKDLHVYAYNVATNAYREIPQEEIFVDSNGYVHFTTDTGGCIILSVGTLTRK